MRSEEQNYGVLLVVKKSGNESNSAGVIVRGLTGVIGLTRAASQGNRDRASSQK